MKKNFFVNPKYLRHSILDIHNIRDTRYRILYVIYLICVNFIGVIYEAWLVAVLKHKTRPRAVHKSSEPELE